MTAGAAAQRAQGARTTATDKVARAAKPDRKEIHQTNLRRPPGQNTANLPVKKAVVEKTVTSLTQGQDSEAHHPGMIKRVPTGLNPLQNHALETLRPEKRERAQIDTNPHQDPETAQKEALQENISPQQGQSLAKAIKEINLPRARKVPLPKPTTHSKATTH